MQDLTPSFHRKVVCLVVVLFLLESIALPLQSKAHEASSLPNVLGRTVRLDALYDDFEDKDWHYDYQKHVCYRGKVPGTRGQAFGIQVE